MENGEENMHVDIGVKGLSTENDFMCRHVTFVASRFSSVPLLVGPCQIFISQVKGRVISG